MSQYWLEGSMESCTRTRVLRVSSDEARREARSHGLELVDALLRVALADVLERLELVDAAPLVLLVDPVVAHQLRRVHRALQVARDLLHNAPNVSTFVIPCLS